MSRVLFNGKAIENAEYSEESLTKIKNKSFRPISEMVVRYPVRHSGLLKTSDVVERLLKHEKGIWDTTSIDTLFLESDTPNIFHTLSDMKVRSYPYIHSIKEALYNSPEMYTTVILEIVFATASIGCSLQSIDASALDDWKDIEIAMNLRKKLNPWTVQFLPSSGLEGLTHVMDASKTMRDKLISQLGIPNHLLKGNNNGS